MAKRFGKGKARSRVGSSTVADTKAVAVPIAFGSSHERSGMLAAMAIIAATLFVYVPCLQGDFLWDDDTYISDDDSLKTWQGLWQIWFVPGATEQYYPLTFTVFWLEYHLWGLTTVGYHIVTVLLHGIVAVLLWKVLASLRVRGALLAGALFALHPVNVMSVAWMTELKNTLSGCLALGSGWAYLRFASLGVYERPDDDRTERSAGGWYVLALVLFALAMLAKPTVSFLPATLLLVLWWQKKRVAARDVTGLMPMVGIALGMSLLTIYIEQHSVGASGAEFKLGFIERVLVSGRSFWFYLGKLIFPFDLTFIYPRWHIDAGAWWQYLYPLAMVGLLTGLWLARDRLGKGVWVAFMHFFMTTSMLILLVVLFMMRYSFVSDHWQYLGAMSMVGLFAAGLTTGLDRLGLEAYGWGLGLKLGLLAGLGLLTWKQCGMYSDNETLYRVTLERNPTCVLAYNNLGRDLQQKGRVDEAIPYFEKVLELNPNDAEGHFNLALTFFQKGRTDEAISQYQKAIEIHPDFVLAYVNLGYVFVQKGEPDEGIVQYQKALKVNPRYAVAHYYLGMAEGQKGQMDEMIAQFQEALETNPDLIEARYNLGLALLQKGQADEAVVQFQKAIEINPLFAEAHNGLGLALFQKGQVTDAIDQFQTALKITPTMVEAHYNLGNALLRTGQLPEAIAEFKTVLKINPGYAEAHNNLAVALFQSRHPTEAIVEFKEYARLNPQDPNAQKNLAKAIALEKAAHP